MAAAALFWSSAGVLVKWVDLGPMEIAGWRSLICGAALWLFMGRPRLGLSKANLAVAVSYCGAMICFIVATKWTSAANAIMLQFTSPIYVALLAPRVLKEPTRWWDWLTIGLGLSGMSLFFLDQLSAQGMWGNVFASCSGIFLAWLFIMMRHQKAAQPSHGVILGNVLTAVIGLPFMLQTLPSVESSLGLIYLGVFQLALGYYLCSLAIVHLTAVESLLICMVEPILNPVWVFLIIGEAPQAFALAGGLLVLAATTFRGVWGARLKPQAISEGPSPG